MLKDPNGLDFTVGFVDGVVRPEDLQVAARNLAALAPKVPAFLPWYMRSAVRLGGAMAPVLPQVVIPVARRVLREMVGHLIVDATDAKLGPAIAKIRKDGIKLNVNLLGEAVLGEHEASRRLEGTHTPARPRPTSTTSRSRSPPPSAPHSAWAFDEAVEHVVEKLTPLFARAASFAAGGQQAKFINLDMEEYKDLDLTIAVFTRILDKPEFKDLEAGIVLQAYLPGRPVRDDPPAGLGRGPPRRRRRRHQGPRGQGRQPADGTGRGLPARLAAGHLGHQAGLGHQLQARHQLRAAPGPDPQRPDRRRRPQPLRHRLRLAAGQAARHRGYRQQGIEFEMLLGMAQGQAEAVKQDVGSLLLYTPVVHPAEFDVAIAYLIRRLEEGASRDNFMSAVFELSENEALFEREKQRFLASLAKLDDEVPPPEPPPEPQPPGRADAARLLREHRRTPTRPCRPTATGAAPSWAGSRPRPSATPPSAPPPSTTTATLNAVIDTAVEKGKAWGALSGAERAAILHRAGDRPGSPPRRAARGHGQRNRQDHRPGRPGGQRGRRLRALLRRIGPQSSTTSTAPPSSRAKLTVVTPPWNFPVAIPAGSTLAALAAGSAVVIKPAKQARRSGAVMIEALWEAGVPRDVLTMVQLGERELGRQLISHPAVDRVILTGGYETAELFRSFRQDLPLLAETSGKNAIIVTPSADLDLAAKDVAYSAFGHAGQKCSAASLVILVGSVAKSKRFHNQLIDAVTSLKVGYPEDPASQMGPIIEPAGGKLLNALTTLGDGESWAVEPKQLDGTGQALEPGRPLRRPPRLLLPPHRILRPGPGRDDRRDPRGRHRHPEPDRVRPHLRPALAEPGGSGPLARHRPGRQPLRQPRHHRRHRAAPALRRLEEVRRRRRAPRPAGPTTSSGSANGSASPAPRPARRPRMPASAGSSRRPRASWPTASWRPLQRALASDALAWAEEFGTAKDVSGLSAERNIFRYRPCRSPCGSPTANRSPTWSGPWRPASWRAPR